MVHRFSCFPTWTLCAVILAALGASAARPDVAFGQGRATRIAEEGSEQVERRTLDAALMLAGQSAAKLPITLSATVPETASVGVQGWTTVGADGKGERIFVYTGSDTFRCAQRSDSDYQCVLKLASVIVHQAWHFKYGANEARAYDAQIVFLAANAGALEQITEVRRCRKMATSAERKAVEAARQRARCQRP